jgi:sulfoxide reductase heme-binding subunit YedZ
MTTWIVLRAAGIGAYVVLFASVAFGLVATSGPFGKRFAKASSISIHQFLSTVGLVLLAIHIGGLLLDTYTHFGPKEVLVPGASSYRPVAVALGVIGMYGTVLVLVSSWFRRHYSPKVWRALHIAAVPTFILAMLHGIFAGADTTRRWMFLMYMLSASVVVFLLILRGLTVGLRPARAAQSSPAPRVSRSDSRAGSEEPVGPEPDRLSSGRSVAEVEDGRLLGSSVTAAAVLPPSGTSTGTETRIGTAGSVSRVPATANAPATNEAATATPAMLHPITENTRRTMPRTVASAALRRG